MKKINIQRDLESRNNIGMSLPAIVPLDMAQEPEIIKLADSSDEPVNDTQYGQSEIIPQPEVNPVTIQRDNPKKGGRKTKGYQQTI